MFLNDFKGDTNTPVAYQMLEGLQAGKNYTWNLLFNRKLNSFLNLNLNYLGRNSENSKTIHTGSVQLRAVFNRYWYTFDIFVSLKKNQL